MPGTGCRELNILVISQYWHPENGVPQRRWQWLTELLISDDHFVTVIAPPPNYNVDLDRADVLRLNRKTVGSSEKGPSGETIIRSGFLPARKSLTSKALSQVIHALGQLWQVAKLSRERRGEFDLVIGTVPALPTALVTTLSARFLNAPYLVDLRDAWPDLLKNSEQWNNATGRRSIRAKLSSFGPLQVAKVLAAWSIDFSLRRANAVTVTTRGMKRALMENPSTRKKPEEIAVIRNVFPIESARVDSEPIRNAGNSLRVLYAGTAGRAQNLRNAIRAARMAADRGVKLDLRVVGAGDGRDYLEDVACKEGIDITFENALPA